MPRACLQFVIVVFPDHTHLLFKNAYSTICLESSQIINGTESFYRLKYSHKNNRSCVNEKC